MSKNYTKPTIEIENFEANEYVAACYAFTCDIDDVVYEDANGNGKLDNYDKNWGFSAKNIACGDTFETKSTKNLMKAFDSKGNPVWLIKNNNGYHAVSSVQSTDNHS